jgi:hypothetical protein
LCWVCRVLSVLVCRPGLHAILHQAGAILLHGSVSRLEDGAARAAFFAPAGTGSKVLIPWPAASLKVPPDAGQSPRQLCHREDRGPNAAGTITACSCELHNWTLMQSACAEWGADAARVRVGRAAAAAADTSQSYLIRFIVKLMIGAAIVVVL